MFVKTIRNISTHIKPVHTNKEYLDLYINSSKDLHNMQNKVIFGSVAVMFTSVVGMVGAVAWSVDKSDKRFEHLEKDVREIKSILKEMNSKRS